MTFPYYSPFLLLSMSPPSVIVEGISHVFEHLPLASDFMRTLVLMEATLKAENEVGVVLCILFILYFCCVCTCVYGGHVCNRNLWNESSSYKQLSRRKLI